METFSCQIYICLILDCKHIGLITKFTTGKANYLRCGSKVEFPYLYVNHKHISLGTWSVELDCKAKRHFLLGPPLGRLRPLARSCFHRLESFFLDVGVLLNTRELWWPFEVAQGIIWVPPFSFTHIPGLCCNKEPILSLRATLAML